MTRLLPRQRPTERQEYPLFAPGRFCEGASSGARVEGWLRRLREQMAS